MSVCTAKLRRPDRVTAAFCAAGRCQRQRAAARRRGGFSLLEAVMAITLAALLMTPVVGILRSGRSIYEDLQ